MTAMNDDDLATLLKKLPRREASSEFTSRVMERLDEPAPPPCRPTHVPRAWVFAGACAALIGGVWLGAVVPNDHDERNERRETAERLDLDSAERLDLDPAERFKMMRDEYRALEVELEELRFLASEAQPVLDLGGTEQVDFVFDLRRLAQDRGKARAQPTSHSPR